MNKFDKKIFNRFDEESIYDYKVRICQIREEYKEGEFSSYVEWEKLAEHIRDNCHIPQNADNIRKFWFRYKKSNKMPVDSIKVNRVTHTMGNDGTENHVIEELELGNPEQLKDENFLLRLHGYNPDDGWQIQSAKSSQWQMMQKGGEPKTLYSSSITVKKKECEIIDIHDFISNTVDKMAGGVFNKSVKKEPIKFSKNLKTLIIEPADMHIGNTTYITLEEQIEKIYSAFNDIINQVNFSEIEHVVITIGNDYYHANDVVSMSNIPKTMKGTLLSSNNNFEDMYDTGIEIITSIVNEILKLNDKVTIELIYISANHDKTLSFTLAKLLYYYYMNNSRVSVDSAYDIFRKYRQYGVMGICFCHGEKDSKKLTRLFPVEAPQIFANSTFREIHAAHYHTEQSRDDIGILVRRISSISPTDIWHDENGYVGATKRITAFLVDNEKGLKSMMYGYSNTPI